MKHGRSIYEEMTQLFLSKIIANGVDEGTEGLYEFFHSLEKWLCIIALGIKPFKDGNQYCFLYGENIQEGICGFGDNINEAAESFYMEILREDDSK